METNYRPELDVTTALGPLQANYYQSQIGVLRWIVELGRMDICTEVSMLASHNALPRTGHLDAVFRIFSYLKTKTNARLVLDPTYPEIDYDSFKKQNWSEFYGDAKEPMPGNAPTAHGKPVEIRCYVDANQAPTVWYSKKQNTVETSTFGSEFIALKVAAEMLRGLRYKLRMMGVPIAGPSYVYCDNNSVVMNSTAPASTLKKKSNSIAYHAVRWSVAADEMRVTHVRSEDNVANILTKLLPGGAKRDWLVSRVLHDIVNEIIPMIHSIQHSAVKVLCSIPSFSLRPMYRYP
jgi:hypothetical protein